MDWLLQIARTENSRMGTREEGTREEGRRSGLTSGIKKCNLDGLWKKKHCKLLSQVSLRYLDFFKEHLKFLVDRTNEMERERGDISLGMEGDSSEAWREIKQMGLFLEVGIGREQRKEDTSSDGKGADCETAKVAEKRERREDMDIDVDSSETMTENREDSSSEMEEQATRQLPLSERVAWAIAHWVELVQAGGQVKDVCLSLLLKESRQLSWLRQEELECTLKALPPPPDSVWKLVLTAVHSKMQKF